MIKNNLLLVVNIIKSIVITRMCNRVNITTATPSAQIPKPLWNASRQQKINSKREINNKICQKPSKRINHHKYNKTRKQKNNSCQKGLTFISRKTFRPMSNITNTFHDILFFHTHHRFSKRLFTTPADRIPHSQECQGLNRNASKSIYPIPALKIVGTIWHIIINNNNSPTPRKLHQSLF